MSSSTIQDLVNLVESLPDEIQSQVILHLQEYIADLQDEQQWDKAFQRNQSGLVNIARQAKQQRVNGQATTLDYNQL